MEFGLRVEEVEGIKSGFGVEDLEFRVWGNKSST